MTEEEAKAMVVELVDSPAYQEVAEKIEAVRNVVLGMEHVLPHVNCILVGIRGTSKVADGMRVNEVIEEPAVEDPVDPNPT